MHTEYQRLDIRDLGGSFAPRSFDAVIALDVIEHLQREEGEVLLSAMEVIASHLVAVFTPNGFLEQPPTPDNRHQEHVSGWTPHDFLARGYEVIGMNGWRPLRGPYASIRFRPERIWRRASLLSQRFVRSRPQQAFQLLAIKALPADHS
jgi:hypothetical protein